MNMRKAVTASLVAGAVSLAALGAYDANASTGDKEKCYGVVKAGHNDCGDAEGKHSCMGNATVDGDANEWVAMPAGLCEKLVGGSLEAGEGGKSSCDAKNGCEGKEDKKG